MSGKNTRPRAPHTAETALQRGEIYRLALDRAHEAHANGFNLEAITLVESLIADRLEAAISMFDGTPAEFGTIGNGAHALKRRLSQIPDGPDLPLLDEVIEWGKERNRALHEFAKLPNSDQDEWEQRLEHSERTAVEGFDLLKRVTAEVTAARRALHDDTVRGVLEGRAR